MKSGTSTAQKNGRNGRGLWSARNGILAAGLLGVAVVLTVVSSSTPASAKPKFMPDFAEAYPEAAASPLNGCVLCHTSSNPSGSNKDRNPYGEDWEEEGDESFEPIEGLDSDGDGYSNLSEIEALSFPGDPSSTPATVTTTTTLPGTPPDGGALYAASCAACHGAGGGDLQGTSLGVTQFTAIVTDGVAPSMPEFAGSLDSAQIGAIYDYVTGTPGPTTTTTTIPGTPPDAAALYAASCAGCHGSGGGNLVPTGLSGSQLVAVIGGGQAPGMPGFASSMSADEIQALADYLIALSTGPTTTTTTSTTIPGTPPPSGAAVFAASCAGCHGSSGGDLVGTQLSLSRLVSVITAGSGGMPGFSVRLSAVEIDAVAGYIRSLDSATTTTTVPATEPDAADLFAEKCASCHGAGGEGGAGGSIVDSELNPATIRSIVSDGTGSMPGFGGSLSTVEVDALVDWVAALGSDASTSDGDETLDADESESSAIAADEADPGSTTTSSSSTTATPGLAFAAGGSGAAGASSGSDDAGRPGSPWVPFAPLLLVVVGLVVFAVRSGRLNLPWLSGGPPPTRDG